jgi:xanthine dehydrogenase accessory factor
MNDLSQLLAFRERCRAEHMPLLLVTIVRTSGSTYRKSGAHLLLAPNGHHEGTISGGCLEADLIETAWNRVRKNQNQRMIMHYDTSEEGEIFWGTGTGCGGQVDLLLEPLGADDPLTFLAEGEKNGEELAIVTRLEPHASKFELVGDDQNFALGTRYCLSRDRTLFPAALDERFRAEFRRLAELTLSERRSFISTGSFPGHGEFDVFCEFVPTPPQLFIFGAGRDALPVVQITKQLGWKVTVAGKQVGAASQLAAIADSFQSVQQAMTLIDEDSFVLIMSHNFLDDLSVLEGLSQHPPRYLGLLGPKARKEKLLAELKQDNTGWDRSQLDRLHGPAGLDLGTEGPIGIALSIVAEMQAVLTGRSGAQLRLRNAPIYSDAFYNTAEIEKVYR